MTSTGWLGFSGIVALLVACGGGVSLGSTGQEIGKGTADAGDGGATAQSCDPSECNNTAFACATGPAFNLRCERGPSGGSAGPNGICMWTGDCPERADPCEGKTLPTCPRECAKFPETGACSAGDACRLQGSTIGDECTCSGGAWQCSPHPPLGQGCNTVCTPAPDPCDSVTLPACPRECAQFPEQGSCTPGDACRLEGSKIGDDCSCGASGTWSCSPHPPLGMGCNLVCK